MVLWQQTWTEDQQICWITSPLGDFVQDFGQIILRAKSVQVLNVQLLKLSTRIRSQNILSHLGFNLLPKMNNEDDNNFLKYQKYALFLWPLSSFTVKVVNEVKRKCQTNSAVKPGIKQCQSQIAVENKTFRDVKGLSLSPGNADRDQVSQDNYRSK